MNARRFFIVPIAVAVLVLPPALHAQTPVGTAFIYQGQLKDGGVPANDEYDFIFKLFDDPVGGAQVGGDVEIDEWLVSDGLFTVELDFGAGVFTGDALWLDVSVRLDGGGEYTELSPRQPLTATPYALYALSGPGSGGFWAANGDHIYNTNRGNVGIGTSEPGHLLHVESAAERAIFGDNLATSGTAYGVYGRSNSTTGFGVYGKASAFSGGNFGVRGDTWSETGVGVFGIAAMTAGINYGVYGQSQSPIGRGVYGLGNSATGANCGVYGKTNSAEGWAGYFEGRGYFSGDVGIGALSPDEALDVDGTVRMTGFQLTTSPVDGYVLTSDAGGVGSWQPSETPDSPWMTSGDDIYYDGGNVGIGMDAPANRLVVTDDTASAATLLVSNSGTGSGLEVLCANTDNPAATIMNGAGGRGLKVLAGGTSEWAVEIEGHKGIWAKGYAIGGVFEDRDDSGEARLANEHYGILAGGNETGGYFYDTDGSATASLAHSSDGDSGIWAGALTRGGRFDDFDDGVYVSCAANYHSTVGNGSKDFVQNHPYERDKVIMYACVEGDEVGTYTRGTARLENGLARVSLGETFKWVTNPDIGLTAHLTPQGDCNGLYVASLTTADLVVRELGGGTSDVVFSYIVHGLRIGFEQASVIEEKHREAYIPSMAHHRELYEKYPDLRQFNPLERFKAMRRANGETEPLDLSESHALHDAIVEFDPAIHKVERPEPPQLDDLHVAADEQAGAHVGVPDLDPAAPADDGLRDILHQKQSRIATQQQEIAELRARLEALEALVARLATTPEGGAR